MEPNTTHLNTTPPQRLDVFFMGSGENGELGLGSTRRNGKKPNGVKRPRLNDLLDAKTVGVVQVAVGGMHCVALTHDHQILTWGVNDNFALGRDTTWTAPERDMDAESDGEDDAGGMNPRESTPTAIPAECFGKDVKQFAQVAATDSASFALTVDGEVYGWGTFCGNDGVLGFSTKDTIAAIQAHKAGHGVISKATFQQTPALIPQLKNITSLTTGGNHVLALDRKGNVFTWGSGQQYQLGRRILDRTSAYALTPCQFGLPKGKITKIGSGAFHSFAIDKKGQVWAWGLNNFGQTGIASGAGENDAVITKPTIVQSLKPYRIQEIQGGNHHSVSCTEEAQLLFWGRCDEAQAGVDLADLPSEDLIYDDRDRPRILSKPTIIPDVEVKSLAAGIDNSMVISSAGEAYSWGFSANYRTGLGTEDAVKDPTIIENSAVKGKRLTFVGCGGQFSVVAGPSSRSDDN